MLPEKVHLVSLYDRLTLRYNDTQVKIKPRHSKDILAVVVYLNTSALGRGRDNGDPVYF